jgi:putative lipoprotein
MGGIVRLVLGILALLSTVAAASAATLTLSGEVTYRERIALPDNGTLRIILVDLAAPDQPRVQAEGAIASPGQVPLSFDLTFDDDVIAEGQSYGLRAEILSGGQVWFRNDEPLAIDLAAPGRLEVVTSFTGRITDAAAAPPVDPTPILDVSWTAEEIDGVSATPKITTLTIARDFRAGGRGGCNSYFSQAKLVGDTLSFSAAAATRMACGDLEMAQEAIFFEALASTRFWRLDGDRLLLLDTEGRIVARLARSAP